MEISKEIEIITPLHENIWYEFLKSVRSTNLKSCPMLRVHVKKVEEGNWFVSRGSNQQCTLIQNSSFHPKRKSIFFSCNFSSIFMTSFFSTIEIGIWLQCATLKSSPEGSILCIIITHSRATNPFWSSFVYFLTKKGLVDLRKTIP